MIVCGVIAALGVLALLFGEYSFDHFEHWWFERKKPPSERKPYTFACPDCRWSNRPARSQLMNEVKP